jgi:hypothetical protein
VIKTRVWVIAAGASAAVLTAATAITAAAFTMSHDLAAYATVFNGKTTVTLSNTDPSCGYIIESAGSTATISRGETTAVLTAGSKPGTYEVKVRSSGCSGRTETARTTAVVTATAISGARAVKTGAKFTVSATGWSRDAALTFALTGKGKTTTWRPVWPERDGKATATLRAPAAGIYVVSAVQGNVTASYTLVVS